MARLFADENFKLEVVVVLRGLGHVVSTVPEARIEGSPDEDVLDYAAKMQRAVLTFNRRDFVRLHGNNPSHEGIVVCTNDDAEILAQRIHQAILEAGDLKSKLLRVNRQS